MSAPLVRYEHDGQGDLVLIGRVRLAVTLDWAKTRFEPIEAWREHVATKWHPALAETELPTIDACMASLLAAIDAAERYRAKWGAPLNPGRNRLVKP